MRGWLTGGLAPLVGVLVGLGGRAVADPVAEPLVLAAGDPEFRAALLDALAPAGLAVVSIDEPPPSTVGIASSSRAIADREHAASTVWLLADDSGVTLITYDRGVDRVLVRSLPYTVPLSSEHAAEAAHMARSMLRALRVTPDLDLPPPRAIDAPAVRARAAVAELAPPRVPPAPAIRSGVLALEGMGGLRFGAPAEIAQGAIGLVWRPQQLGLVARLAWSPRDEIREPPFTGTVADDTVVLAVRRPLSLDDRLIVVTAGGAALHLVRLRGDVTSGGEADVTRFDPALHAEAALHVGLGSATVGVALTGELLLRRQSYDVGMDRVAHMLLEQLGVAIVVTAPIL